MAQPGFDINKIGEGDQDQLKYNQMAPGMPGAYPQPGMPGAYQQPGMQGAYPQPGMPGAYPQPGMPGPYQQPGMQGAYPQPGMPGAYPNPGMPGAYPQPGMPGAMGQVPLPPGAAVSWMQRPEPVPGCPVGLEYFLHLDGLMVKQETSLTEVVTGFDTNNKYVIMNTAGIQCYYAKEESDTCMRMCCGNKRSFTFHILDNMGTEVARVNREFKCCAGNSLCAFCCDCAAYEVTIEAPVGNPIGYVKQAGSFWKACYNILDENHEPILKIEGPCCVFDGPLCCSDTEFKLLTLDGDQIGKIAKKYSGYVKELATAADNFGINFPIDLSAKAKASLLGALLLIDFMFFEQPQQVNNNDN